MRSAGKGPWFHRGSEQEIAFAEGIAVVLGRLRGQANTIEEAPVTREAGRGAGGAAPDRRQGAGKLAEKKFGGALPRIAPGGVLDKIGIPADAMAKLKSRGQGTFFDSLRQEREKLKAPEKSGTLLLEYWRSVIDRDDMAWPYASSEDRQRVAVVSQHGFRSTGMCFSTTPRPRACQNCCSRKW